MLKRLIYSFLVLFLFIFPSRVFAAAPNITSYPSSINIDTSFKLNVEMTGLSSNTLYRLRIVLASTGTSNYFGSTFNGTDWYNGTPSPIDYSKFLTITTDANGEWQGEITGKVESSDSNYNGIGPGTYDLKVGRYTQSGSTATWSNVVQTSLLAPTATPIPSSTPTPIKTPTPTPTPKVPTKTPTPTLSKAATSTPTKKPTVSKEPTEVPDPTAVLGARDSADDTSSSDTESKNDETLVKGTSAEGISLGTILIILGGLFLVACGGVVYWEKRKKQI